MNPFSISPLIASSMCSAETLGNVPLISIYEIV